MGKDASRAHVIDGMKQYVDILCREIESTAAHGDGPLDTVYFGGGTPSLLPPE